MSSAELHVSLVGRDNLTAEIYRQLRDAILAGRLSASGALRPRPVWASVQIPAFRVQAEFDFTSGIPDARRAGPVADGERRPGGGRRTVRAAGRDRGPGSGERSNDRRSAGLEDRCLSHGEVVAVAAMVGERGATVYVTGRSLRGRPSAPSRSGSIEETAEEVIRRGGTAVAVSCDHTIDAEIAELFERVRREQRRLDLLVNTAWGGYEQRGDSASAFFGTPFWEQPLWRWQAMFGAGVRTAFVTSRQAAPLLLADRRGPPGLIINTIAWAFGTYLGNVLYDTAKAATARLALGFAHDLRPTTSLLSPSRPATSASPKPRNTWAARSPLWRATPRC